MDHFGEAILIAVILLVLGTVTIALVQGPAKTEFSNLLTNFFSDMDALRTSVPAGP